MPRTAGSSECCLTWLWTKIVHQLRVEAAARKSSTTSRVLGAILRGVGVVGGEGVQVGDEEVALVLRPAA